MRIIINAMLAVTSIFISTASYGQEAKFGVNTSYRTTFTSGINNYNPTLSYIPSIGFNLQLSQSKHSIASLYSEFNFVSTNIDAYYDIKNLFKGNVYSYLYSFELPLMLDIKLGRAFHIRAGGYMDLLLDADTDYVGAHYNGYGEAYQIDYNYFDYGFAVGCGFSFNQISLDFRYRYSLTDITHYHSPSPFFKGARTESFEFSISYFFNLSKPKSSNRQVRVIHVF